MNRQQAISSLKQHPEVSALIVGAGINGIGAFRDLALNGIDTLIIDRGDFCGGASAASSRMLHGGLRYLENGEFRLVREALHERNRLLHNAPHYARPLPTTIPVFKWLSGLWNAPLKFLNLLDRPAERGAVVIKIGLMLYDAFVRGDSPMPGHYFRSRGESLKEFPALNPQIVCTANYYDGMMVAMERLCIELILDAEAEGDHAKALNYVSVAEGRGDTVTLRDETTGERLEVKPRIVINAAGPWIDFANRAMGRESKLIGGTKGSHLVLDHPELRKLIGDHEFFFENVDGRIVLVYPLMDKILVGTTDIPIDDPDQATCTTEEEMYILELIRKVFPSITVEPAQIIFRYAGVRPLPASQAKTTGQISRDHSIQVAEAGGGLNFPILSLVGGKWTTYRAFSEQAADAVLARLGKLRQRHTQDLAIGGGRDYPADEAARTVWITTVSQETGLDAEQVGALFHRYGTRARQLAEFIAGGKDQPLNSLPAYTGREITFLAECEKAVHLDDLILRRTLIGVTGATTLALLAEVADVAGKSLGWPTEQKHREVTRVADLLATRHGIKL